MRVMHMLHPLEANPGEYTSTVRLGTRWADSLLEDLILCSCVDRCQAPDTCNDPEGKACIACDRVGTGRVTSIWIGSFGNIPAKLIRNEHEARSREYNGLFASMKKAYGDKFSETSEVTVVEYKRIT